MTIHMVRCIVIITIDYCQQYFVVKFVLQVKLARGFVSILANYTIMHSWITSTIYIVRN